MQYLNKRPHLAYIHGWLYQFVLFHHSVIIDCEVYHLLSIYDNAPMQYAVNFNGFKNDNFQQKNTITHACNSYLLHHTFIQLNFSLQGYTFSLSLLFYVHVDCGYLL